MTKSKTKAAKPAAKTQTREHKPDAYIRTAKVLAQMVADGSWNPDPKALGKQTGMSTAMASYCLKAWDRITTELTARGWLKLPKAKPVEVNKQQKPKATKKPAQSPEPKPDMEAAA